MTKAAVDEDSVRGLRNWRTNVAANIKHVDPLTGVPLAVRVCANDPGLEYNAQAAVLHAIAAYTQSNAGLAIGPLLTVVGACCNRDTAYRLYRRIRLLPMADGGRILPGSPKSRLKIHWSSVRRTRRAEGRQAAAKS